MDSSEDLNFQKLYELSKEELKKQTSKNSTLEARVEELNRLFAFLWRMLLIYETYFSLNKLFL